MIAAADYHPDKPKLKIENLRHYSAGMLFKGMACFLCLSFKPAV